MSRALTGAALLAAFGVLLAGLALTPISNNDVWLHLKTGSLILERGAVPRAEEYTFTQEGAPLVDHEWLAQLLFAAVHAWAGVAGLQALKLLLAAAAAALVHAACTGAAAGAAGVEGGGRGGPVGLAVAALVTAASCLLMGTHLFIRPHLFTFVLAAGFARLLPVVDGRGGAAALRAAAALVLLEAAWANLHGGFVVGILLAALHAAGRAAEERRAPRSALLVPALAAAALVNPYGAGVYELVGRFAEPAFREHVTEWRSPFAAPFAGSPLFWVYLLWLTGAALAAGAALRRGGRAAALTAAALGLLSATSRRHVSLMAVVTAPILAGEAARLFGRSSRKAGAAASFVPVAAVLALGALVWSVGLPWERGAFRRPGGGVAGNVPVEALEVMVREKIEGRVYATMAFGAYVTFRGWPALRTFLDSRLEVFGGEMIREYERAGNDPAAFDALRRRVPFDLALLSWRIEPSAGPVEALARDPDWALIYFDDLALLYARRAPGREDLLDRRAYRVVHPALFAAGSGISGGADPGQAEREARRAVAETPRLPGRPPMEATARVILGAALQRQGRHAEAAEELRASLRARPDAPAVYGLLGVSLMAAGDRAGAREAFLELRRRVPGSRFAEEMLRQVEAGPAP
jgi:hypothetical protein